jgi:hypothetical protein
MDQGQGQGGHHEQGGQDHSHLSQKRRGPSGAEKGLTRPSDHHSCFSAFSRLQKNCGNYQETGYDMNKCYKYGHAQSLSTHFEKTIINKKP